jgi:hypothetical protein
VLGEPVVRAGKKEDGERSPGVQRLADAVGPLNQELTTGVPNCALDELSSSLNVGVAQAGNQG